MREKEFIRWLNFSNRSRQKVTVDKGKIQRFVVQYESYINAKWHPIIRYDTAHGFIHKDILHPNGAKTKNVFSYLNHNEAFTFAEIDIQNNWQRYLTHYLEKMKND